MISTLKRMWWTICASLKGIDYEDYLRLKKQRLEADIASLPDTPNVLSFYGHYYGFVSATLTLRVLAYPAAIVALVAFCLLQFSLLPSRLIYFLVLWFAVSQVAAVALGVFVRLRYSVGSTTGADDRV